MKASQNNKYLLMILIKKRPQVLYKFVSTLIKYIPIVSEHCEVGTAETQSTKSAFSIPRAFLFGFGAFSLQRRPSASQVLQDFKWLSGSVNSPHLVVTQTSLQYQNKSCANMRIIANQFHLRFHDFLMFFCSVVMF